MVDINVSKVFVTHWDQLEDRREFMEEQFMKNGIHDVTWVTEHTAEEIESEEIKEKYPLIFETRKFDKNIRPAVISLLLKHCRIIEEIVKNEYASSLIFEDDAILVDDFTSHFNHYASQLPLEWDLLWVGTCCDIHARNINEGSNIYDGSKSRCCHAYLVSLECAKKIHDDMYRVDTAIDWYFNALIKRHSLKSYWAEPPLSFQNKSFRTTLQTS